VWEGLDRGPGCGVNAVGSVHTTEVGILPCRPTKGRLVGCLLYGGQEQFNSFNVTGLD